MGNKRKALTFTALVESGIVNLPSNEPKIILDKIRFVSIEAQMFHDKLALIASSCLERGIDFNGPRDDKIGTYTAPGDVRRALCSDNSNRAWYKFVKQDTTVVQFRRRLVNFSREITNAYYQILNIAESELAISKRSNIDYDLLLRELCVPSVPENMATWKFYPNREHKQFLKTWLFHYALVWYQFLTSRILPITHSTKVALDRAVPLYALVKDWSIDIGLEIPRRFSVLVLKINVVLFFLI
ncbi:hypothetical protein ACH5RR_025867 [Cinchona calisaya]|uniref:Uncharacterized protein n=1 Tax=Cinchona calisaya TaxID=153742 RepID=A0ABD2Z490_9GENT